MASSSSSSSPLRRALVGSAIALVCAILACGSKNSDSGSSGGAGGDGGASSSSASSSSSGDGSTSSSSGSTSTSTSSGASNSTSSTTGGPPPAFVNITQQTMQFGGKTRQYLLGTPKTYDPNKKYPLVLSFHGNPGNAAGEAAGFPFDSVSKNDAVVVYPDGDGGNWDLYTATADNADMNWIKALPDDIATHVNIDKTKILGFGYSGGAFFVVQFTCRFGGQWKMISVNAGGGPDEPDLNNVQKRDDGCVICAGGPIPALVIHGTADNVVEPSSGDFTAACLSDTNGCNGNRIAGTPAPCQDVDGCPTASPVKWCLVPGLGHTVWDQGMGEAWTMFNALP